MASLSCQLLGISLCANLVKVLLIHGRYDRMMAFEVSTVILNHIADLRFVLLNACWH
jgi:hypothetical protein